MGSPPGMIRRSSGPLVLSQNQCPVSDQAQIPVSQRVKPPLPGSPLASILPEAQNMGSYPSFLDPWL